jgi:hypothetical protein
MKFHSTKNSNTTKISEPCLFKRGWRFLGKYKTGKLGEGTNLASVWAAMLASPLTQQKLQTLNSEATVARGTVHKQFFVWVLLSLMWEHLGGI